MEPGKEREGREGNNAGVYRAGLPGCLAVIRVAHAAYRMRELHDRLNRGVLQAEEQWPYMPHLTIAKLSEPEEAQRVYDVAHKRWHEFQGSRRIYLGQLTFVREKTENSWLDLAPVPLGGTLVSDSH